MSEATIRGTEEEIRRNCLDVGVRRTVQAGIWNVCLIFYFIQNIRVRVIVIGRIYGLLAINVPNRPNV